jgi:hypothetical protein
MNTVPFLTSTYFFRSYPFGWQFRYLISSNVANYHYGKICLCENAYREGGARVHKIETDPLEIIGGGPGGRF